MLASDQGRAVTKKYLNVAKSMREYEQQLYVQWCQHVDANSLQYLKTHILLKEMQSLQLSTIASNPSSAESSFLNVPSSASEKVSVNFRFELKDIIKETKYLDKMGFNIPEAALNIALQEDKYFNYVENLNSMLKNYSAVLDLLDSAEKKLLQAHITELKRVMNPGFSRLNWNSLGIPEFIQRCNQEINKFSSLVNQIRKNSANVAHAVDQITRAMLVKEPPTDEIQDAFVNKRGGRVERELEKITFSPIFKEFFDFIGKHRLNVIEGIVQKYRSIGPLLIKMESLVCNTNTGKSPILKDYYAFWERRIFMALNYVSIFISQSSLYITHLIHLHQDGY